ncbi:arylamine N-acetyltransferase [Streptomyces sp. WAC06614]|uniref:arylamine N-acetyltransferase family protein n=1 Tax=Streptomyces sp. WAC06614 TaxID=2487416 RepID=UPI000F77FA2C|nr:arylamine N-acetyltransferase [Streptomyces sp. WAC06614]RSS83526.1 arylamine N-acetyltransferase [Streptomyces sp. WAC06614]
MTQAPAAPADTPAGRPEGLPAPVVAGYLRRLGFTGPPAGPSAAGLFALHRAHLERVPYENLDIQLGRPPAIDPELSARRIAAGRGGYCFHLNGAFSALLRSLGYEVTRHIGGVCQDLAHREVTGNHLVLTVRAGGTAYFVDAGLGDGPYEPLPLRAGTYRQGPFTYRMEPLPRAGGGPGGRPGGWSFLNEAGPNPAVNFRAAPATMADFAAEHRRLSTAEDSVFVRTLAVFRRDAHGIDALRGRTLSRTAPAAGDTTRELTTPEAFFAALTTVFGCSLAGLTPADRALLWERTATGPAQ